MSQQLTPQILIRLILVKQAYYKAVQSASEQTDIGNIFAIQQLDFAIETLLKTVISHKGSPTVYNGPQSYYKYRLAQLTNETYRDDSPFPRLFDEVVGIYRDSTKAINNQTPPLRSDIELIHQMRNDSQHNGISPSPSEVQRRLSFGESFIMSLINEVFNLRFDQLMFATLISNADVRNDFQQAEIALNNGNIQDAIGQANIAFARARDIAYDRFLQRRGLEFSFLYLEDLSEEIARAIDYLRQEMEPILLGVDPLAYSEFLLNSPEVASFLDGHYEIIPRQDWHPTKEDAIKVLNFVFSTLMRWRI